MRMLHLQDLHLEGLHAFVHVMLRLLLRKPAILDSLLHLSCLLLQTLLQAIDMLHHHVMMLLSCHRGHPESDPALPRRALPRRRLPQQPATLLLPLLQKMSPPSPTRR